MSLTPERIIQRAYKTELDLNNVQKTALLKHAGCARFAYNWGLARVKNQTSKPNAMMLHKELNTLKQSDFPWMYEVSKCAMQEALRDLQKAFVNFFEGRAKFPTFKSKHDSIRSLRLTGTIKVEARRIQLPRLGWLRLKERGYIPTDAHILSATISEQAGRWYISILVKEEIEQTKLVNDTLGIDLGIKTLATCSDGTTYANPKALAKYEEKLKRLQRKLSRQEKGSKRRKATKTKIARVWAKIKNVRKDGIQKATTDIVKTKRCQMVLNSNILNVRISSGVIKWSAPEWKPNKIQKFFGIKFQFRKKLYDSDYTPTQLKNLKKLKKAIIQANGFCKINEVIDEPITEEEIKAQEELAAYLGIAIN